MRTLDSLRDQLEGIDKSGPISIIPIHALGELVAPEQVKMEEIDGEWWIKYRFPVSGKTRKPQGAIFNFIKLADQPASSEQFLKFAQRWGVLCFCEHNMVASHSLRCFPLCDEPTYTDLRKSLEKEAGMRKAGRKMMFAGMDVWFKEPLSLWIKYAGSMRAVIRIFMHLRGDLPSDTLEDDWNILRQLPNPSGDDGSVPRVEEFERLANEPIHLATFAIQASALAIILNDWIMECNLVPHIGWYYKNLDVPESHLAAQCYLKATYMNVGLFESQHLTLFSTLVEQCIRAIGSQPYFRRCACIGCNSNSHIGNCQELVELKLTRGRPSPYCETCYPYIRQQQKNAFNMKRRKERSNQQK